MVTYIAVLFGIFIFSIYYIVLYNEGIFMDLIKRRLASISGNQKEIVLDEEFNKTLSERFIIPIFKSIVTFFSSYIPDVGGTNKNKTENMRRKLRQAGMLISPNEYTAIKIIVIVGATVLFFILGLILNLNNFNVLLMPLFGAYASFAILRFNLSSRITKRKELMERQLPDVLDMVSLNVEAGLGFEQAILHVIEHFEGPLIDELTITYREMSMGRPRREALMLLGERCDIDDLKTFTGAVVQAGKMGISLKNVLRTQAASIRQGRRNRIEEKAMKISVKMLIPMVMFIFPVIFIVLMGPAVIDIIEVLGGM